ncbi:MAG: type IX secretion system protein PorQ [Bacteroidales bacterium]|nr:type IX secretion system protein PorQ [Bacteroidales bacterium]
MGRMLLTIRKFWSALPMAMAMQVVGLTLSVAQTRTGAEMGFLDVPQVSRLVGSGGMHIAPGVSSSSLVFHNPSAVADSVGGEISLSVTPVTEGVKYASAAYAFNRDGVGTFAAGLVYAGYGDFERRDETGAEMGQFAANEGALYLSFARTLAPWLRLGATIKPIYSKLADYTAFAIAMDMGATFSFSDGRFNVGVTLNNAGGMIKKYSDDETSRPLPLDVKAGILYKPLHAPFRIMLTVKDLAQWDLSPERDKSLNVGDNIMRHTIIGLEFVPVRAFYVAMGYDHRRRKELTNSDAGGMAGFAWGAGLHVAKIDVQYAHCRYHVAGSLNSITLATNWRRWAKR